jgi:predicted CXXCH cytochrome family protein
VKRLVFLVAGSTVLLTAGVGTAPAFADNGPHKSTTNIMNEDRCAGCHRAHTASAAYLLTTNETALCQTCHGAAAGGSALDVVDGVGYSSSGTKGSPRDSATAVGALRGGGFTYALISSGAGVVARNQTVGGVTGPMIPALATNAGTSTTSTHNVGASGTAWGGGGDMSVTGAGTSVALQCGSCHDPHGGANSGQATWRILKVKPTSASGVMVAQVSTASWAAGVVTFTTMATHTIQVGETVSVIGVTPTTFNVSGAVTAVTGTTFSIALAASPGTYVSGGIVTTSVAVVGALAGASGDGTTVSFTTAAANTLIVGQVITITGATPTTYNLSNVAVASVVDSTHFTVTNAATGTWTAGGIISTPNTAIADASTKNYVTTNYWSQDDTNAPTVTATDPNGAVLTAKNLAGVTQPAKVTSVENGISKWCTQCHTRLLAGSGSYQTALAAGGSTTDAMYAFRHRSDANTNGATAIGGNGKAMGDSPNCLTCHVSHGSNASMQGSSDQLPNQWSLNVKNPDGSGSGNDSFLLRVDNRGTCQMCHNK